MSLGSRKSVELTGGSKELWGRRVTGPVRAPLARELFLSSSPWRVNDCREGTGEGLVPIRVGYTEEVAFQI